MRALPNPNSSCFPVALLAIGLQICFETGANLLFSSYYALAFDATGTRLLPF